MMIANIKIKRKSRIADYPKHVDFPDIEEETNL
jgi:hypothetical protein